MSIPTPNVTLDNGVVMPQLGFGVLRIPDEETASVVTTALDCGYRRIGSAAVYGDETGVGHALASSGIPARNCSSPPNCGTRSPLHTRRLRASEHLRTDWRPRAVSHQPRV